jgi:hypothetical protein
VKAQGQWKEAVNKWRWLQSLRTLARCIGYEHTAQLAFHWIVEHASRKYLCGATTRSFIKKPHNRQYYTILFGNKPADMKQEKALCIIHSTTSWLVVTAQNQNQANRTGDLIIWKTLVGMVELSSTFILLRYALPNRQQVKAKVRVLRCGRCHHGWSTRVQYNHTLWIKETYVKAPGRANQSLLPFFRLPSQCTRLRINS